MVMKIENYETFKSSITADTFTFPHNPNTFNDSIDKEQSSTPYPYNFTYFWTTGTFKSRRNINISGHFDGANKELDYLDLSGHVNDNKVKKLYFATDRFYIVFPSDVQQTHAGGRTNFIDYTANFTSPFGIAFGDSQKSGGLSATGVSNAGNVRTPVEKVTGTVTNGVQVIFKDVTGNGFRFTPSIGTATGTMTVYLLYTVNNGDDTFFTEYYYCEVEDTSGSPGVITTYALSTADYTYSMFLGLDSSETLNDVFNGGSGVSGISSVTVYFRDGYSG